MVVPKNQVYLTQQGTEELVHKMIQRFWESDEYKDNKTHFDDLKKRGGLNVYGVPGGGVPVAYLLASLYNLGVTDDLAKAAIIVDDIVCSGKTKARVIQEALRNENADPFYFDALLPEPEVGNWYVFPWEASPTDSAEDVPLRMLQYIGEDPRRDGLIDTPKRIVKSWDFLFKGYHVEVSSLFTTFENDGDYDQMVILKDIEFYSMCEHHALPFFGKVHIAYLPGEKIVGVSKLARVVEAYSRRLQVQERLTEQIASALETHLKPKGVAVYIEAQHLCMVARGVQKQNSVMVTSSLKGHFRQDESRMEFLLLSRR